MSTEGELEELAIKYCPIIQFASGERYLPASFEHFCQHSDLMYDEDILVPASPESPQYIRKMIEREMGGSALRLSPSLIWKAATDVHDPRLRLNIGVTHSTTAWQGLVALATGKLVNDGYRGAPDPSNKLYGDPKGPKQTISAFCLGTFTCRETNIQFVDIVYSIQFMWNGTLESHPFDIEFAILRFSSCGDATTSGGYGYRMQEELGPSSDSPWKLRRIFLSAHGNGCWYPTHFVGEERSVIEFAPHSSRPLLYSALGSHALYPNTRRNKRILGFGDDKTNDRGLLWVPTHVAFFSPMFQVRTGNVQMQPPLKCLRLCDGQSELAPDPLLYLNMFRGEIGTVVGGACVGCQELLPFKNATNLLTNGDSYYKLQRGGVEAAMRLGLRQTTRKVVVFANLIALLSTILLLYLAGEKVKRGGKNAHRLVYWIWLPLAVSLVSAPVATLVLAT